ncbi:barstar family protein [Allokutzneria oryzae]|uniref:Barstar family protein n=1 Tax=Allokutzneria oryzae TaxID=1378989 RepID=A0ABV5ZZW8_9PSEU
MYVIPAGEHSGREGFFRAIDRVIRLSPPLLSARSWDAFSDSLWEGIDSLGSDRIVIIWPDSSALSDGFPEEFELALAVLDDVARMLADPGVTSGNPKRVSIFVGRSGEDERPRDFGGSIGC